MPNERASDLMYDTAAALRLLDAELGELAPRRTGDTVAPVALSGDAHAGHAPLPEVLVRAMHQVHAMLASIRSGREHIRSAATERLAHTNEKLDEVSSTTGKAALDIMDALDRAIVQVNELETDAVLADARKGAAIRTALRNELFDVMGHMQFQDITSQQIMHVQSLLADMEARLTDVANMFDHPPTADAMTHAAASSGAPPSRHTRHFDPNATLANAGSRQALADALVERGAAGGP
jgi:chemotaxis regulatin CheY-phosphate phosphatase CheZ